jgi:hypothetical protein
LFSHQRLCPHADSLYEHSEKTKKNKTDKKSMKTMAAGLAFLLLPPSYASRPAFFVLPILHWCVVGEGTIGFRKNQNKTKQNKTKKRKGRKKKGLEFCSISYV